MKVCAHCNTAGPNGEDHTCSCSYSDHLCPFHKCNLAPKGWYCSKQPNHDGPCPAWPKWWNIRGQMMLRGWKIR